MVNRFFLAMMVFGFAASAAAESVDAVMLKYMVSEQGLEPYPSRIIITDKMLRMDDGEAAGDYLLFDLQRNLISSVTHGDETILEIPQRLPGANPPIPLKRDQSLEADEKAPAIGGKTPHQMRLFVNDKLCYDAVVVPGLLPDVVEAMRAFNRVLGAEQARLVGQTPEDLLDGCDLALHTFYPTWTLESGLAIQEIDMSNGKGRLLVDIAEAFQADESLFRLPEGYRRYQTH
ncbi:MAG: hypothetical protein OEZ16_04315 [Chromatiales bacterium]|nr:hypothetical protein [Chromatiales bacterium]